MVTAVTRAAAAVVVLVRALTVVLLREESAVLPSAQGKRRGTALAAAALRAVTAMPWGIAPSSAAAAVGVRQRRIPEMGMRAARLFGALVLAVVVRAVMPGILAAMVANGAVLRLAAVGLAALPGAQTAQTVKLIR